MNTLLKRQYYSLYKRTYCTINQINLKELEQKSIEQFRVNKIPKDFYQGKPKYYCLSQFPYPSGNLHMGHARVYFIADVISRFEKLRGKNVLNPMGWDAFGLPAENAAISRGIEPARWTYQNIEEMKKQMDGLGLDFDWENEIFTCKPDYYKWTQWIFIQLYKNGLAYRGEAYVNWDPVDMTVLANEQVDENGRSWRSGAKVQKKIMKQWFLRTTAFAKELNEDLNELRLWPENVKEMQKGWIGASQGVTIKFPIQSNINNNNSLQSEIEVFTSRIDTIYGVTFLGLAFEHELAKSFILRENQDKKQLFDQYMKDIESLSETQRKILVGTQNDKFGILLENTKAIHPLTQQEIPIYLCNYVLTEYGKGAIMGVPAHDDRDYQFAQKYNINIVQVNTSKDFDKLNGILINSKQYNGLTIQEAQKNILNEIENKQIGHISTEYKMRDWLVSRQRYWGCPIPIIICNQCGDVPVLENQLPVILPENLQNASDLKKVNPLSQIKEFHETQCPKCGNQAKREMDTLDTFCDSSWYFLRFMDSLNNKQIFNSEKINEWMPVDVYIGGMEHAIMHLLYARFINKFLHQIGLTIHKEPFQQLITQGLVKGKTYILKENGKYLYPEEAKNYQVDQIEEKYEKMSKSKNNGVNPIEIAQRDGSDILRMTLLFYGPSEKDIDWDTKLLNTINNFLEKSVKLIILLNHSENILKFLENFNFFDFNDDQQKNQIKEFSENCLKAFEGINNSLDKKEKTFHVGIARLMEFYNTLNQYQYIYTYIHKYIYIFRNLNIQFPSVYTMFLSVFIISFYPFAPYIASEMWQQNKPRLHQINQETIKNIIQTTQTDIRLVQWPNPQKLKEFLSPIFDTYKYSVFINGKSQGAFELPQDFMHQNDQETFQILQKIEGIQKKLNNKTFNKIIKGQKRDKYFINVLLLD